MNTEQSLKHTVDLFVASLREDMRSQRLRLPTLPDSSVQALFTVNCEDTTIDDVAALVMRDASMAARVVRYANSPMFRGVSPCSTIKSAITRLGLDKTKHLLLALAMKEVFDTGHEGIRRRMETLWSHSVEVAMLSMLLALRYPHLDPETALLGGLVHDVGIIPILDRAKDHEAILQHEASLAAIIGAVHAPLGKAILNAWRFAPVLVSVAAEHDRLQRDPGPDAPIDYVDIVQAANIESYRAHANHPLARLNRTEIPALRRLGCTAADPELHWDEDAALLQQVSQLFT